jgi:hypothetical protein
MLESFRSSTPPHILDITDRVWARKNLFVLWSKICLLFIPDAVRVKYHQYTTEQKGRLGDAGITPDSRSNGPAIIAYRLGGGERPHRISPRRDWSIHHIYDGKFPAHGASASTHAVNDGRYFTEAAGLVAVHLIADALADEVAYFAWLLRRKAFDRFGFDPDGVFTRPSG